MSGDSWVFVDREHRPYDITELRATLAKLLANKNAQGQPALAPIVRVPTEGDQDVRWVIKQVLESGAMGIIVPQVENAEQALKVIQSMRYPQLKTSKYQNPPAGAGAAVQAAPDGCRTRRITWRADVWPLNPDGELMAFPMIENPEGVKNINAIRRSRCRRRPHRSDRLTMNYGEGRWANPADKKPETEAAIKPSPRPASPRNGRARW
jgi:4-hydroxy-2-oxoheptanedioate aldolase